MSDLRDRLPDEKPAKKRRIWSITAAAGLLIAAAAGLFALFAGRPDSPVTVTVMSLRERTAPETEYTVLQTAAASGDRVPADTAASDIVTTAAAVLNRDLNTASAADLQRVRGVGEQLAGEILRFRGEAGGFRRRAELLEIPGIGEALCARIMEEFVIPDELPPETQTAVTQTTGTTAAAEHTRTAESTETTAQHPFYDLNAVTLDELMTIPGMTEQGARSILDVREKLGGYQSVYETALAEGLAGEYVRHTLWEYLYIVGDKVTHPRQWQTDQGILDSAAG